MGFDFSRRFIRVMKVDTSLLAGPSVPGLMRDRGTAMSSGPSPMLANAGAGFAGMGEARFLALQTWSSCSRVLLVSFGRASHKFCVLHRAPPQRSRKVAHQEYAWQLSTPTVRRMTNRIAVNPGTKFENGVFQAALSQTPPPDYINRRSSDQVPVPHPS